MNHERQETIKELKAFLGKAKKNTQYQYKDFLAVEDDILWNASYFFTQLISRAKPSEYFWSLEKVIELKKEYEKRQKVSIDLDQLISKHWLRVILGFVEIPLAISNAAYFYGKHKKYRQELSFLIQLKNEITDKEILNVDFKEKRKDFEAKHSHKLNIKYMFKYWIKEKENKISVGDIEYQQLIDNWQEFRFIHTFREKKYNQEAKGLFVTKGNVNRIHSDHKRYFKSTPELEELIKERVLRVQGSVYILNIHNINPAYCRALKDKIGGLLWEYFIKESQFNSDKERLKTWIQKILYWFGWPDIFSYITGESKKRYLDAALNLVLEEPDLVDIDNEFTKMRLDDRRDRQMNFVNNSMALEGESLNNQNHFELLHSLEKLDDNYDSDLLRVQEVRENIAYLLKLIVSGDYEYETVENDKGRKVVHHYPRVKRLLKDGINKPYLLWETCHFIAQDKPEIIPYLLIEKAFASLSIKLIDRISFADEIREFHHSFKLKVWKQSLRLALDTMLQRTLFNEKKLALFIFQVFRQLNRDKYRILYNPEPQKQQYNFRKENYEKGREILELVENYPKYGYNVNQGNPSYFLPPILFNLFSLFKSYSPKTKYRNRSIQFPMIQLDGLAWLLKCLYYGKYKVQIENQALLENKIAEEFLDVYLNKIEQNTVKKLDYRSNEEKEERPFWSEKIERLELIEWIYPIHSIYKAGKLNDFLYPRLKFKKTTGIYDEDNIFNAEKLRTHIGLLLQVLRKFSSHTYYFYAFDDDTLKKIQARIESQIVDYVSRYGNSDSSNNIDIFDSLFETQFQNSAKEELLPQLAQAINWFSNKESIINALANSSDLVRMLIIADWITSEGIKKILINKIKETEIRKFLKSKRWIPEIQLTMSKLIVYPELIDQAKKALEYWEENITRLNRIEYQRVACHMKMILAYKNKDEKELNKIQIPKLGLIRPDKFTDEDSKQFYRGLIRMDSKPEEGYQIFNDLHQKYDDNIIVALNRFAAKITWATNEKKTALYREALEEWDSFEKNAGKGRMDSIQDKVWINKLTVHHHLKEYEEVEKLYLTLEKPYRMLSEILTTRIESLLNQRLDQEAKYLLKEARAYHRFSDGTEPEFLGKLKEMVDDENYIQTLKRNYIDIFESEPSTLIKIFPPYLNGKKELKQFLTKEIAIACDKMLDKVLAVNTINDENKYNDIIQLILEARMNTWGWQIKDQSRGGKSFSGKSLGERDLKICDHNSCDMVVCEAFIFRGPKTAKAHIEKVFGYHHKRNSFIMLIYFLGKQSSFEKKWINYCEEIVPNSSSPKGFSMRGKKLKDITNDFGYNTSAIKVGKATHGKDTSLFHIMVNINYNVN